MIVMLGVQNGMQVPCPIMFGISLAPDNEKRRQSAVSKKNQALSGLSPAFSFWRMKN